MRSIDTVTDNTKHWFSSNGIGLIQLIALGAIFYITSVSGQAARDQVDTHDIDVAAHPELQVEVRDNNTELRLLAQKYEIIQEQNEKEHGQILKQLIELTSTTNKVMVKLESMN